MYSAVYISSHIFICVGDPCLIEFSGEGDTNHIFFFNEVDKDKGVVNERHI